MESTSNNAKLDDELEAINAELVIIDDELQDLLARKERLLLRKKRLKDAIMNAKTETLNSTEWDRTDFEWSSSLETKLRTTFCIDKLRSLQLPTMNVTLSGNDCILVMPTGGGKSLCFQLPALVSKGFTLVVTPLVSLMEDQYMALKKLDYPAEMINANSGRSATAALYREMFKDEMKLLYVTPEKMAKSKLFMNKFQKAYNEGNVARVVIDEVHCCSQWGNDFRPDYKFLGIVKRQFPKLPILGLTATATSQVIEDVKKMLNLEQCLVLRAPLNRPNLHYEVREKPATQKEAIDELEQLLKTRFARQTGIIYCFSTKETDEIAKHLRTRNIRAASYHAHLDPELRSQAHEKWTKDELQVIVATIAFGMGIDKPDVRYVIHFSLSKSMENYYQESGRAGRDDKPAYCILYYRLADVFRLSTMVYAEKTGSENLYAMVRYCIDSHRCRRSMTATHFGEKWNAGDCNKMCDHCQNEASANIITTDITRSCTDVASLLDNANSNEKQLTAQQVIDLWLGKGTQALRLTSVSHPRISREACERRVAFLLIEGYLKEDFHFTPYSTISYLATAHRGSLVKNGKLRVEIENASKRKFDANSPPAKIKNEKTVPTTNKTSTKKSPIKKESSRSSNKRAASQDDEPIVRKKREPINIELSDDD